MKHIITGLEIRLGRHCYYSAISNLMGYYGYQLSEAEVFILFGGLDMKYDDSSGELDLMVKESLPVQQFKNFSFDLFYTEFKYQKKYKKTILDSISENKIVILAVQNKCLTYNEVYQESGEYLHFILMYGFDTERNLAYIADTFMLDNSGEPSMYEGVLPLKNIEEGLGAYGFLSVDKNCIFNRQEILLCIKEEFSNFINGKYRKEALAFAEGNQAIEKYSMSVFDKNTTTLEQDCYQIIYNLKFGIIIPLLEYIAQLVDSYGDDKTLFAEQLLELKGKWNTYFILLLKVAFAKDNQKLISQAKSYIMDLLEAQKETLIRVEKGLNKSVGGFIPESNMFGREVE